MATYSNYYDSPAPTADLFTYQDALEHLEAHTLGGAMDSERRDFRSAFLGAYSDLASRYDWLYYHTEHEIRLEATYSTGTIAYDHTGGSNEREVTLSGGTWPTNVTAGRIKISDVRYPIATRESSTVITLPASINPGVDVAASTSYTWLRSSYTLPGDFKDMDPPHTENSYFNQRPVSLDSIMAFERHIRASSNPPRWYAIGPDPNLYGQMAMYVQYEPSTAEGLRFFYRRYPRRVKYSGTETAATTGTLASASAGQAVLTGYNSSTAFNSDMVGSVIRIGTTDTKPSGVRGLNPYTEQRIISAVNSSTQVTLDANLSNAVSDKTK